MSLPTGRDGMKSSSRTSAQHSVIMAMESTFSTREIQIQLRLLFLIQVTPFSRLNQQEITKH